MARYELDIEMCNDEELRSALYDNVLTGCETATMRKEIKALYALMNREEMLERVKTRCGGKLFVTTPSRTRTAIEAEREERKFLNSRPISRPTTAPSRSTPQKRNDPDKDAEMEAILMGKTWVQDVTVIAPGYIGVTLKLKPKYLSLEHAKDVLLQRINLIVDREKYKGQIVVR